MERRFEVRLEELLDDAVSDSRIPNGMLDRLERFVQPFAAQLTSNKQRESKQREHVQEYVAGLCSDVKRKNAETIAYLHDQERHALQKFIACARPPFPAVRRGEFFACAVRASHKVKL